MALCAACAGASAAPGTGGDGTVPGVGVLPPPAGSEDVGGTLSLPRQTIVPDGGQVGDLAAGNRVIIIGDSIMASTSARYTDDMCKALVPLGWQVELDAETGKFIDFGNQVLDARLKAKWDAAVILLGNNYGGNKEIYRQGLERMVERLSPQPVVLLTVTEFQPNRADVNDVIRAVADAHHNVILVDWATTSHTESDVLGGDGLHLSNHGRAVLAANVALALGTAPAGTSTGKCLVSQFTDDSGGSVNGTTTTVQGGTRVTTTTRPRIKPTTTTTKPATTVPTIPTIPTGGT